MIRMVYQLSGCQRRWSVCVSLKFCFSRKLRLLVRKSEHWKTNTNISFPNSAWRISSYPFLSRCLSDSISPWLAMVPYLQPSVRVIVDLKLSISKWLAQGYRGLTALSIKNLFCTNFLSISGINTKTNITICFWQIKLYLERKRILDCWKFSTIAWPFGCHYGIRKGADLEKQNFLFGVHSTELGKLISFFFMILERYQVMRTKIKET